MPEPGEDARVVRVEHAAVEAHGGAGDQRLPAVRVLPRQPVRLLRLQSVAAGVQQAVRPVHALDEVVRRPVPAQHQVQWGVDGMQAAVRVQHAYFQQRVGVGVEPRRLHVDP